MEKTRTCLSCKGKGYKYNYSSLRYTLEKCSCCNSGLVPFDSSDDGYGPFYFVQHIRTTEIWRNNRRIGITSDLYEGSPESIKWIFYTR
jgi:hypothetical protein